jgi:hypothetical protein
MNDNTTDRLLAVSPCGKFTLLERLKRSNADWVNIIVATDDDQWKFGWNGLRISYCDDSEDLRRTRSKIFIWAVETLKAMTTGSGSDGMRACRRDWLIRLRDKLEADRAKQIADLEKQAAEIFDIEQQILLLDPEASPVQHTTGEHSFH